MAKKTYTFKKSSDFEFNKTLLKAFNSGLTKFVDGDQQHKILKVVRRNDSYTFTVQSSPYNKKSTSSKPFATLG